MSYFVCLFVKPGTMPGFNFTNPGVERHSVARPEAVQLSSKLTTPGPNDPPKIACGTPNRSFLKTAVIEGR